MFQYSIIQYLSQICKALGTKFCSKMGQIQIQGLPTTDLLNLAFMSLKSTSLEKNKTKLLTLETVFIQLVNFFFLNPIHKTSEQQDKRQEVLSAKNVSRLAKFIRSLGPHPIANANSCHDCYRSTYPPVVEAISTLALSSRGSKNSNCQTSMSTLTNLFLNFLTVSFKPHLTKKIINKSCL